MIVITDRKQITEIAEIPLRQLIEQRIQGIEDSCPWDAEELGPIIVVEPGDTADDLEHVMGFSILESIFDESRFGDENFAPSFEVAEVIGDDLFELVYVINDGGYGYDIFIMSRPGTDPTILAFCQTYAVPAP